MCFLPGQKIELHCRKSGYVSDGIYRDKTNDHYVIDVTTGLQLFDVTEWELKPKEEIEWKKH